MATYGSSIYGTSKYGVSDSTSPTNVTTVVPPNTTVVAPKIAGRRYPSVTTIIDYTSRGATVTQTKSDFEYHNRGRLIVNLDQSEIDKQVTLNTERRVVEPNLSKIDSSVTSVRRTRRGAIIKGNRKTTFTSRGATVDNS